MTRQISIPGFRLKNGKLEKVASYRKNVSQRIAERKSKKQRVVPKARFQHDVRRVPS